MANQFQELSSCVESIYVNAQPIKWGTDDLGFTVKENASEFEAFHFDDDLDLMAETDDLFPQIDLMAETDDLFPQIDLMAETDDLFPQFDLMAETEYLFKLPAPKQFKVRNRRRGEATTQTLNETSTYLYADNEDGEIRYSEWQKKMINYIFGRHNLASSHEEAKDLVGEFLTWAIKKNKLAEKLNEGKKIYFNWVQGTMFWQFITRTRETQGQDAHSRMRNRFARTQQEKKKKTEFHFVPRQSANVVHKRNEDRKVTSTDMYYTRTLSIEEEMYQEQGWSLLYDEVNEVLSDNEDKDLWLSIMGEFLHSTFEDVSSKKAEQDRAWADSHQITVKELRSIRRKVLSMLRKNKKIVKIVQEYMQAS